MIRSMNNATVDYSHCVLTELAVQLGQLRERTVNFVDSGNAQTRKDLTSFVKEVSQTLDIINCHGAKLLTDELYELLNAVADGNVTQGVDASPVLVLASEKLNEYLDYLQAGGLDLPLALLPLINDMRACRGVNLLSEALIVAPLFNVPLSHEAINPQTIDPEASGSTAASTAEFYETLSSVRLSFMQAMLGWLREPRPSGKHTPSSEHRRELIRILDQLQQQSPVSALRDLWRSARAVCVSVEDTSLENHPAIKMLFGQLERFLGQLVEKREHGRALATAGEPSLLEIELPVGLFKNLLYYVALSRSADKRVLKLQKKYRLHELLPPRAALDSAREALGGPNAQLAGAICKSLASELNEVKALVASYEKGLPEAQLRVKAVCQQLEQISHTFLLLGVPDVEVLCQEAASSLMQLTSSTEELPLDDVATQLLQIEGLLDEFRHSGNRTLIFADSFKRNMLDQRRLSAYHYDQIVDKCLGEARRVMSTVETAYLTSLEELPAGADATRTEEKLKNSAQLLSGIQSALLILPLPELVPVLKGAANYLEFYASNRQSVSAVEHRAFADLMVNAQTYLEPEIQKQSGAGDLLAAAETALTVLGDSISALAPEQISEQATTHPSNNSNEDWDATLVEPFDVPTMAMDDSLGDNSSTVMLEDHGQAVTLDDAVDPRMLDIFTEEALETFTHINRHLQHWQYKNDGQELQGLRRCYHTLKGSGRVVGAVELSQFAANTESLLSAMLDASNSDQVQPGGECDLLLRESVGVLPQLVNQLQSGVGQVDGLPQLQARMFAATTALAQETMPPLTDSAPTLANLANEISAGESTVWTDDYHERTLSIEGLAEDLDDDSFQDATHEVTQVVAETSGVGATLGLVQPTASVVSATAGLVSMFDVDQDQTLDLSQSLLDADATAVLPMSEQTVQVEETQIEESWSQETLAARTQAEQTLAQCTLAENALAEDTLLSGFDDEPLADNSSASSRPDIVTRNGESVDGTLFRVFESETRSHLHTLDFVLKDAAGKVPDELLSRTLHTMHGSARAAGIDEIAELVEPLEQFASRKTRALLPLDQTECAHFANAVSAIDEALTTMSEGRTTTDSSASLRQALAELERHVPRQPRQLDSGRHSELVEVFIDEAGNLLASIQAGMVSLIGAVEAADGSQPYAVRDILRPLHTLKGSARVAGCGEISNVAHALESALLRWPETDRGFDADRLSLLQESVDALTINLELASAGGSPGHFDLLVAELNKDDGHASPQQFEAIESEQQLASDDHDATLQLADADLQSQAKDFEATILDGIQQLDSRQTESIRSTADLGEKPAAAQFPAHIRLETSQVNRLSELSTDVSVGHAQLSNNLYSIRDSLVDLEKTTSRLRLKLRELDMETDMSPQELPLEDSQDLTLRVDPVQISSSENTSNLTTNRIEDSRQLSEVLSDLDNIRDSLHTQLRRSEEVLSNTTRLGADLHESLLRSRLVRFDQHQNRFASVIRQTAVTLEKQVDFEIVGGEQSIDRKMHNALVAPIEHLLRNAVSHGIESPEQRKKNGKSPRGLVRVEVSVDGSDLSVVVRDDGSGVKFALLREQLQMPMASDSQLLELLIQGGVSTAKESDQISGRGIGLDSTAVAVLQLGGVVAFESTSIDGSIISMRIPQRVVLNQAILVEHRDRHYAIPVNYVRHVVSSAEPAWSGPANSILTYEGKQYTACDFDSLLGLESMPEGQSVADDASFGGYIPQPVSSGGTGKVLLMEAGGRRVAVRPQLVAGFRELITRPLGMQLESLASFSGASVLPDGSTVLILELSRLLDQQGQPRVQVPESQPSLATGSLRTAAVPKVLVVDDSVTMRAFASGIIEQAGYHIETARDGLEALQAVNVSIPDLIFLDIEMPRMDGFEFLQRLREDPLLKAIDVVIISSRTGERNLKKARELGVVGYLGKPYQSAELSDTLHARLGGRKIKFLDQTPA